MGIDPVTLTALSQIGTALSVAGGVVGAVQSLQQGNAARKAYNQQAEQRLAESRRRAEIQQKQSQQERARARVAAARSGVDIGSGSPLEVAATAASNAKLDELEILRQGTIEANNLRFQGAQAKQQGTLGFVSGILGAAGSASKFAETSTPTDAEVPLPQPKPKNIGAL